MTSRGCFKIHMLPTILALKQCGKYRGTLKLWSSEPVQVCSRKDPASRPSSRCWGTGWCWQCSVLLLTSTPQLWSSLPTPLHFTARNLEILFGNILCNMEWLTRALSKTKKGPGTLSIPTRTKKSKILRFHPYPIKWALSEHHAAQSDTNSSSKWQNVNHHAS